MLMLMLLVHIKSTLNTLVLVLSPLHFPMTPTAFTTSTSTLIIAIILPTCSCWSCSSFSQHILPSAPHTPTEPTPNPLAVLLLLLRF
jgi:hypothetical protein